MRRDGLLTYRQNLGAVSTMSRLAIPPGFSYTSTNAVPSDDVFVRSRRGMSEMSLTSGPSTGILYLFTERTGGTEYLWAHSSASSFHRYNGSSWSSVALSDSWGSGTAMACAYNGKVFWAYDSDQNRLHVSTSGGAMRRVGIGAVSAPAVANTGAGAYAATGRYYKIQMRLYSGSVVVASSELSPYTGFIPSGAGTAAQVARPTVIDSATHWVVYGSEDGITFYDISGAIAVATTTYNDSAAPSTYSASTNSGVAPEAGLFVPPPSCKFLASNGERLVMAGAWETSASSGETTPSNRRVWFTRPLGATDKGDDESVTQTASSRYYLDIDNEDGSSITGLASAMDGAVFVFTATSIWRLSDTGQADQPFRADRVSATVGALLQKSITFADAGGLSALYFVGKDGPYRYSASNGVEWIGEDQFDRGLVSTLTIGTMVCGYDPRARLVYYGQQPYNASLAQARVLRPDYMRSQDGVLRGGWALHEYAHNTAGLISAAATYGNEIVLGGYLTAGGISPLNPTILRPNDDGDDDGTAFTTTVRSGMTLLHEGAGLARVNAPTVCHDRQALTFTLRKDFGGNAADVSASVSQQTGTGGDPATVFTLIDTGVIGDARALDVEISYTAATDRRVHMLTVPYQAMERP